MTFAEQIEERGRQLGRQEGRQEARHEIAKEMLKLGYDRNFIKAMVELSEQDLLHLED